MIALALVLALASVPAPALEWHTIHTKCCDVHYPITLEHTARRVATIADESVVEASAFLHSAPLDRVQVVIHDVTDDPNGFTNVVPYDDIDLRMVTPEGDSDLAVTDEYLHLLIQHEILHVVHLDTIHGFPSVVNLIIGKVWPPNLVQPRFMVEGLAVFAESRFTKGGRLRSRLFDSDLLIAAQNGDLWQLDDLSSYSRRNPGGGGAYAYGAAFVEWLAEKYGDGIWAEIANDYGGQLVPFALNRTVEGITGHDFERDYQLFLDDVRAQASALKAASEARGGPTVARRLTRFGGTVTAPHFDAHGALWFGLASPDAPPVLARIRGLPNAEPRPESIARTTDAADVALVDDTVVIAQTEITRGSYVFHDLWRVNADGSQTRITREARVRAPSAIPGMRAVVCEHRTADEAALVIVDVDTGKQTDVVREHDGAVWYTPDASPDGRHVTASRWSPGGAREIVEIDLATGVERVLVGDAWQNLNPSYTSDGSAVLFSSDREGMFSIYAVERGNKAVHRIVDSLGLAKAPRATPDGLGVIYVDTGLDGNDLYAAPLDIAHAPVVERGPPAPPLADLTPESSAVPERYNAFGTLLPHYWIPLLATDAAGGPAVGAAVVGADAVGQLSFSAQATYGFAIERPHLAATVRFSDLYTPISVSGEYRTDRSDAVRRTDGQPDEQQEQVLVGGASLSLPIFRGERFSQSLTLGYARELHIVENPLTSPPDARAPVYPPNANIGAVTLDWGYDGIDAYRDSVSNERGFTSFLHLRHAERLTGSTEDITEAVVDARAFTPVPGLGAHVVGLYLSGGVAIGNPLLRDNFFLGGFQDRDITSDLISGNRNGAGVLRGYPSSAFVGDAFALATVEYRFPLLEIEHGFATVPIFFDRVHGAFFSDLGEAWDGVPNAKKFRASVGVELQLQVTLAYYGLFLVRAGYARGVSQGGVNQPYVVLGFPY